MPEGQNGTLRNTVQQRAASMLGGGSSGSAQDILQKLRSFRIERGPGLKDVLNFTSELSVMLKSGIGIRPALSGIAAQIERPRFAEIVASLGRGVEAGQPLSEALAKYPKVFSPLYVNMVRAAELSGNLGQMLERLGAYLDQRMETRRMVRGAMIYPIIIAVMAVVTTVFLLTFVLPKFTALFAGKESLLPTPTLALMAISKFMRSYWYSLVIGIVALVLGFMRLIKTPKGREYWDRFKLRLPVFRKMLRALYISRSVHTMGELITAGVPVLQTIKITADVSGNTLYRRMWQRVGNAVKQGEKIAGPLSKQALLPKNVVQMLSAGEESGKLGQVLQDISEYYSKELRSAIKSATSMIEPLMIVMMGFVVGFIAMSIILPIFKMSSLVK